MAPLDRANVDTDAIIPKQFLKSIKRSGFGQNLFDEWRYLDHGEPGMDAAQRKLNPDFILNLPRYHGAQILLARSNFGCGSSREHAPWALQDYGFQVLSRPASPIFFSTIASRSACCPLCSVRDEVDQLFREVQATEGYQLVVDLEDQSVITPGGGVFLLRCRSFPQTLSVEWPG